MSPRIQQPRRVLALLILPLLWSAGLAGQTHETQGTDGSGTTAIEAPAAIQPAIGAWRRPFAKETSILSAKSPELFKPPRAWWHAFASRQEADPAERRQPAFWSLAAVATLMTFADLESTQDCLHDHRCTEANPLMPSRRAKVYAIQIPELLGVIWGSHRLRRAGHSRLAQIPLAALIAIHTAGTILAIRAETAHR
jgi:hypothetical protein